MSRITYIATYNLGLGIAPLILWAVPFLMTVLFFIRSSVYRNGITITSMLALLFGTAASSVIAAATAMGFSEDRIVEMDYPPYYIFYGLYFAFTFVPALIAFLKLEKQNSSSANGKYIIYFGFLWMVAIFAANLTETILSALYINAWNNVDMDAFYVYYKMYIYADLVCTYFGWGCVLANLTLTMIYFNTLPHGTARKALCVYTAITTIQQIIFTILTSANFEFNNDNFFIFIYLELFLVQVPIIISIVIMFFTGHCWIMELNPKAVLDESSNIEQQKPIGFSEEDNKLNFLSDFLRIISFS